MINKIYKKIDIILDFLIAFIIIIQDVDKFVIFGTPFYKYVILLMFFLLLIIFLKKNNKIKINKLYALIYCFLIIFTIVFNKSKIVLIPSIFLTLEIITFTMYIQSKRNAKQLMSSLFNVIYFSAIFISLLSIVQFLAYKLNLNLIYSLITQNVFYLNEGRYSSIYTEPAHLCTIIASGLFISMYYIVNNKKNINYIFLSLLIISGLLSGSIIVYFSLVLFSILFIYYCFFTEHDREFKKRINYIALIIVFTFAFVFLLLDRSVILSAKNKIDSLLSNKDFGQNETIDIIEEKSDDTSNSIDSNNENNVNKTEEKIKEEIEYVQIANGTSYALKSNLNICISKLKNKYFLGTGLFSHVLYYDEYMKKLYPLGYIRFNYVDACSMLLRIFSEVGIIGLVLFIFILIYMFILAIKKKNLFLLFFWMEFISQSMRMGEYNWLLICLPFLIMLNHIKFDKKYYLTLNLGGIFKNEKKS